MFFVFGSRPYTQTIAAGQFYCPRCRRNRNYKHKTSRQQFHIYFIPVAPAGEQHEFIECQSCRGTFVTEVLYYRPGQEKGDFEAIFEKAVRRVLVHMMMADAHRDDVEVATIQRIYTRLTGSQISEAKIRFEGMKALSPWGLRRSLRRLAPMLNDEGRRVVLEAARSVALADASEHADESALLKRIALALGLTASDYQKFMVETRR